MKDIFWTDLLKFFFELKSKENIPLNVDSIIWYKGNIQHVIDNSRDPYVHYSCLNLIHFYFKPI
jgi:hypothetical protein